MSVGTYIISLKRAPKRAAMMRTELANAGVEATFLDAVDMQAVPQETLLESCKPDGPWGPFDFGNMACTLSHALAWETFLASDHTYAMILEDDIFMSPETSHWLADLGWWPKGSDLVKLEFWRSGTMKLLLGKARKTHLSRDVAPLLSRHPGSAAYIVTRAGAEKLLASRPFSMSIDQLLFNPLVSEPARTLHPYQITPALVTQGNHPDGQETTLGARERPRNAAHRRQKIKRGWAELRAVPCNLFRLASGKVSLERISYQPEILNLSPPNAATASQSDEAPHPSAAH